MAEKFQWALNPSNVASIDAMDDFYGLYLQLDSIYEETQQQFLDHNGNLRFVDSRTWDKAARKKVRAACEPIMNKYLPVFTSEHTRIFATAYGFEEFFFLNMRCLDKPNDGPPFGKFRITVKSYEAFLIEFQYAVTRVIHQRELHTISTLMLQTVQEKVNNHILSYVVEHTQVKLDYEKSSSKATSDILYIYDNLSSIGCYINNHTVVPSTYTAELVMGAGKVTFPVHYCTHCQKYFIGEKTLQLFEKNYGKMRIVRKAMGESDDFYGELNAESKLHQLGYNVSDGKSDEERQALLMYLLEKNYISYFEMARIIEWNINHAQNKPYALPKWKSDLKFIGEYIRQKS